MKKLLLLIPAFALIVYLCQAQTPRDAAIGCWEMPSRSGEHLQTYRNGEFTFHDYNSKTKQWDDLTGKWDIKSGKLTLLYFDRPKQTFTVKKHGNTLTLTKAGGFEMRKADPSKCQ